MRKKTFHFLCLKLTVKVLIKSDKSSADATSRHMNK